MSVSKWPKLSFENPRDWSQHATTLQGDFDSLRTYLDSNKDKGVPNYLFGILHASYSSLNAKLARSKSSEVNSSGTSIETPGETGSGELLDHATTETAIASRHGSDDESESGSQSESESESKVGELGIVQNNATQVDEGTEGSTEETETKSDDVLSDDADTTVSDATSRKEANVLNPECVFEGLTVPVVSPYLVRHFKKLSSADLLRNCVAAIRGADIFAIPFSDIE